MSIISRDGITGGTANWNTPLEADLDAVFGAVATLQTTLAGEFVDTSAIGNYQVTNVKIADNAINERTISNNAVTNAKIADDAVDTDNILDDAVTPDKMSTSAKYASNITLPATADYNMMNNVDSAIENIYETIGVSYAFVTPPSGDVSYSFPSNANALTIKFKKRSGYTGGVGMSCMFLTGDPAVPGSDLLTFTTQRIYTTTTISGIEYFIASFAYAPSVNYAVVEVWEEFAGNYSSDHVYSFNVDETFPLLTFDAIFDNSNLRSLAEEVVKLVQIQQDIETVTIDSEEHTFVKSTKVTLR
jgi:hypothetical protein